VSTCADRRRRRNKDAIDEFAENRDEQESNQKLSPKKSHVKDAMMQLIDNQGPLVALSLPACCAVRRTLKWIGTRNCGIR
jgi:hypothetical protein